MAKTSNLTVKNKTGSIIKANTAVYITGQTNDDDQIVTVAIASNTSETKMPAVGITIDDIANGESGNVRVAGPLGGFNTSKIKSNTLAYIGSNGAVVFRNPSETSPNAIVQQIGTVINAADTPEGQIFLYPVEVQSKHANTHRPDKSDAFLHAIQHEKGGKDEIDHGKIKGLKDDDHPQYTKVNGTRSFTGVISGVYPEQNSHLATKEYIDDSLGGGAASSGQVAFYNSSNTITGENNLFWDAANDRLGVKTNAPLNTIDIAGSAVIGASLAGNNTAPTNGLIVEGNVVVGGTTSNASLTIDDSTADISIKETSSPPSNTSAYAKIYVDDDAVSHRMRYVNDLGYHYSIGASNQLDFKNNNAGTLTNTWYYCNGIGPATTTGTTSINTITATPFTPGATRRIITDIGYYNTTVATTNITYAIYEATSETNLYPSNRIFQGTEVAQGAAAGFKTADTGLSLTLEPGKLYWIAFNSSAISCAIRSPTNYNSTGFILGMSNVGTLGWQRIEVASAYASALPTSFPASAVLTTTLCPTVMFAYGSGL